MSEARRGLLPGLGWGAYLGASWTWCIGTFWPILLVRDFGPAAWWVFALPNVLGAALMGWALRDGASERFVERHRAACRLFGAWTLAFHVFFVVWLAGVWAAGAFALAAVLGLAARGRANAVATALLVWLASAGWLGGLAWQGMLALPARMGTATPVELAALAAPLVFGFALGPYLDLTFHRARQATAGGAAKLAFGAGFGGFFALMIVATPLYGALLLGRGTEPWALVLVLSHVLAQCALTIGLHVERLVADRAPARWHALWLLLGAMGATTVGLTYKTLPPGEATYRAFLTFYGVVAPAYVWLRAVRDRRGGWATVLGASALALPFYWLAFFESRIAWAVPGTLVLLAAGFIVPRARPAALPPLGDRS